MAKKALLDVLEQTIGKYVRNLDAESLNVAVWSGKIALNNLELDVAAVNAELDRQAAEAPNLALPFRVRYGKFHKFQVEIPWAYLMSKSVVLRAQGLEVSIEPHDRTDSLDHLYSTQESEAVRIGRIQAARARSIEIADEFRKKSNALRKLADVDGKNDAASSSNPSTSFGARLARRIIENIQMEICNVHITLAGDEGSAGVVLNTLQLATTDKDGKQAFVDRTSGAALDQAFLHKVLRISGLGIYLEEASTRRMPKYLSVVQEDGNEENETPDHPYVLQPLSFEARLRQADTNACIDYPKYALVSELSALSIELSRTQMELVQAIADKVRPALDITRPLFPEYRPLARVSSETAREWWKYGVRCIGRINGRRSWVELFRAFELRKDYIQLYKRSAHRAECTWLKPLSPSELVRMDKIERDRTISVEGLMIWRTIADAQFEKEQEKGKAKIEGAKSSLFSSIFRPTPSKATRPSALVDEPPITLSTEEMKELEAATMENVSDGELSGDSKLCDAKFTLGSFRINLKSHDRRELVALDMGTVSSSFNANVDGSFEFDVRLTSLEIYDKVTTRSLFPTVLKNQQRPGVAATENDAFRVHFGKSVAGDQSLRVVLNAFEAVASPILMVELKRFLSFPPLPVSSRATKQNPILAQSLSGSVDLFYDAAEGAASVDNPSVGRRPEELFISSRMANFSLVEAKSALAVDLDLQAPILVLPENCVDSRANILVFDMGHLRFKWLKGHQQSKQNGSLGLTSLAFFTGKASDWRRLAQKHDASSSVNNDEAVIEPMSASVDIALETLANENSTTPTSFVVIHAKFSSLNVNWNPQTVKMIASELEKFRARLSSSESHEGPLIITSPTHRAAYQAERDMSKDVVQRIPGMGIRFIAELERFRLSLNSARDGFPLFVLTMSGARVSRSSSNDEGTETSLVLDDVSISSPDMGRTDPMYRTVLGLSPGLTESLLTVKYYEGRCTANKVPGEHVDDAEAYGDVELSPMRMVYIHAQVMALVEYATAGILGALATQVATTAALAAAELATASTSRKIFRVRATNMEVLLPQAAYRRTAFSICSGTLQAEYTAIADMSSSAKVELDGFELKDPGGRSLQHGPIRMSLDVILPAEDVGSSHDQAMRVSVVMPNAGFIVPKSAYSQLLSTLDENIGEVDLCLRDDAVDLAMESAAGAIDLVGDVQLTHAGTVFVEKQRRMYIRVDIGTMSLELASVDQDDPIVRLAAVDASILLNSFPDEGRTTKSVTLRNLNCDDQRMRAVTRQYRSLVYQQQSSLGPQEREDVFSLIHEKKDDLTSQKIEVSIGSQNLVFIPDAVADVLKYLDIQSPNVDVPAEEAIVKMDIKVDEEDSGFETSLASKTVGPLSSTTISLKTSKCGLILVDLGSDALLQPRAIEKTSQVASVAETIVFEGRFELDASLGTEIGTGNLQNMSAQVHGDELECYSAFGRDSDSALQILEPTKVSLYVNMKHTGSQTKTLDVKAATMEPVDVILSMRNVALISAILTSISSCFDEDIDGDKHAFLDESETRRIERLASALEKDDADMSVHSQHTTVSSSFISGAEADGGIAPPTLAATFHITAPSVLLTVINDLQGLDEPLFRLTAQNSVASARIRDGAIINGGTPPFTMFDFNTHVSLLADFFDQTTNSWKALLVKAWEVSTKGGREQRIRFQPGRPSTFLDIECFPCYVSFSEQFLMGLASACNMWSVYSCATEAAKVDAPESKQLRKSLAASAARKFVTTLPYAIENHTGIVAEFFVGGDKNDARSCESGSIEYFRFKPPRGRGCAGRREYGQDVSFEKSVTVVVGGTSIPIRNIDTLPGNPRRAYILDSDEVLMINVVREGKTIVVHLSSGIEIRNGSSVALMVSLVGRDGSLRLGVCEGNGDFKPSVLTQGAGKVSKAFGVPMHLAGNFWTECRERTVAHLRFMVSPEGLDLPEGWVLSGTLDIDVDAHALRLSDGRLKQKLEVLCQLSDNVTNTPSTPRPSGYYSFVLRASTSVELVEGRFPSINVAFEPRATIENMLPISIDVRSPMPHVIGVASEDGDQFTIKSQTCVEIFTPGPSIAVGIKCSDMPVAGTATGWMDGGWIDLPLVPEFRLPEPLRGVFPFVRMGANESAGNFGGSEFFLTQGSPNSDSIWERASSMGGRFSEAQSDIEIAEALLDSVTHAFYVTVCNFAIDHTGDILFEQPVPTSQSSSRRRFAQSFSETDSKQLSFSRSPYPLGAFATHSHRGRITLLPGVREPIRLLHLTMQGDEGVRRSAPFCIEEITICDGGAEATPLKWENGSESGFFAYRQLVNAHQTEIHVVPEFIVFNGSKKEKVRVRQPSGLEFIVEPGAIAPLRTPFQETAVMSVECVSIGGRTAYLRVDSLGLRVAIVKSKEGFPLGSLAVQTVVGGRDSRLVVKLGEVKFSQPESTEERRSSSFGVLENDFLRCRVQWSVLEVSMYEARPVLEKEIAFLESAMDRITQAVSPEVKARRSSEETWVAYRQKLALAEKSAREHGSAGLGPVCTIIFDRFTIDWQRVFKDNVALTRGALASPERSQLLLIIHHIQIKDDTPGSPYPIVLQSTANVSFVDLCIRLKGPLGAELIKVDLFDLNIAHANGVSEKIIVNTSEDFVWKFLDLANRIVVAAGEFAGIDMELAWDDEHDGYKVMVRDKQRSYIEDMTHYAPPKSDTLLDIRKVKVSPFALVISFKRNPQSSRYAVLRGVRGANIMNYFTRQLKFKIDRAELQFARYETQNLKGPPDRLWEVLSTVYTSRMKFQLVTLVSAASFQDWKSLSNREGGNDAFMEGDLLRATGNLSGQTAKFLLNSTGRGLGHGVTFATSAIGNSIESATSAIGMKPVGAGVNSVVSGVGSGTAKTLTGVGKGAGQVVQGVGQGMGHVLGGVSGGALMIGKGIGKGITKGDGSAVVSGVAQGLSSLGTGVGQGVESVVSGTAEGVLSVGKGLFSGVKSVGKGIGGAFRGKSPGQR